MTTTAQSILDGLQKAMLLRVESRVGQPRPMVLAVDAAGVPVFRAVRDRLGDIIRIYRASPIPNRHRPAYNGADLRAIRAQKGVGRPPMTGWVKYEPVTQAQYVEATREEHGVHAAALVEHGSQRAAARALGLALSTFQRRLAKEAA